VASEYSALTQSVSARHQTRFSSRTQPFNLVRPPPRSIRPSRRSSVCSPSIPKTRTGNGLHSNNRSFLKPPRKTTPVCLPKKHGKDYRDRIVHIKLCPDEGGLNLNQTPEVTANPSERGGITGRIVISHFNFSSTSSPDTGSRCAPCRNFSTTSAIPGLILFFLRTRSGMST
jgi:hypothetical protein